MKPSYKNHTRGAKGECGATLDSTREPRERRSAMHAAEIHKQPVHCVSQSNEKRGWDWNCSSAGPSGDQPRIVDPVTFRDAAKKVLAERAGLLRRLAE